MSCILVLLCSLAGQRANAQGDDLGNELVAAASRGDLPRVKALLAANADVNAKVNAKPVNGLRSVIVSGQARLVDGETALMLASREGHLEVVRALFAARADVNTKDDDGGTALMYASQEGHLEVVRALLTAKADVNVKMNNGATALMYASQNGLLDVV
jgi:ankyrin repeat protein